MAHFKGLKKIGRSAVVVGTLPFLSQRQINTTRPTVDLGKSVVSALKEAPSPFVGRHRTPLRKAILQDLENFQQGAKFLTWRNGKKRWEKTHTTARLKP